MRMILNNVSGSFFLPTLSRGWVLGEASGNFVPFSGVYVALLLYKRVLFF
jgi:hypothetical protein